MLDKQQFEELLNNYPNKLTIEVSHISLPPTICYYDFTEDSGFDALRFCKREVWDENYKPTGEWVYRLVPKTNKENIKYKI